MENITYIHLLNSDLMTIILSQINKYEDLYNFIKVYDSSINWKDAFIHNYPYRVRSNFTEYNVKNLYLGFKYNRSLLYRHGDGLIYNIEFTRYIIINNIFDIDNQMIGSFGDIIIYENKKNDLHIDVYETIAYAIDYNNEELVEHIFKDDSFYIKEEVIENILINYDSSNIEMIKLILKYYPRLYGAVIENIYQIEIFSYILDNYILDSDTILNILKRGDRSDDAALFVKLIVDKYYDKIKDELPDIYKKIVDKMIIKVDHYNILVYLSQLEIINKKYRI